MLLIVFQAGLKHLGIAQNCCFTTMELSIGFPNSSPHLHYQWPTEVAETSDLDQRLQWLTLMRSSWEGPAALRLAVEQLAITSPAKHSPNIPKWPRPQICANPLLVPKPVWFSSLETIERLSHLTPYVPWSKGFGIHPMMGIRPWVYSHHQSPNMLKQPMLWPWHIHANTKPGVHLGGNLYWNLLCRGMGLVSVVSCWQIHQQLKMATTQRSQVNIFAWHIRWEYDEVQKAMTPTLRETNMEKNKTWVQQRVQTGPPRPPWAPGWKTPHPHGPGVHSHRVPLKTSLHQTSEKYKKLAFQGVGFFWWV